MTDPPSELNPVRSSFLAKVQAARFTQLLITLTLLLFIVPFVSVFEHDVGKTLATLLVVMLLTAVLVAAALAVSESRRQTRITLIFATACLTMSLIAHLFESASWRIVLDISTIGFLIHVVRLVVRHLFRQHHVDFDMIAASLCGYLLIGVAFAAVFSLAHELDADAISTNVSGAQALVSLRFGDSQTATSLYFSFVTLTTLGYGDITPISMPTRMLATAEALIGQLYLVILVARLVALDISNKD